jgi:hypothetical protein
MAVTPSIIVVAGELGVRDWKLNIYNLEIVLFYARGMCANQKAIRRVVFPRLACHQRTVGIKAGNYVSLSGNHWVVKVGHSRA